MQALVPSLQGDCGWNDFVCFATCAKATANPPSRKQTMTNLSKSKAIPSQGAPNAMTSF